MLLARLGLTSWIGDRPVLVLFMIPIIVSAYVGGLGPGLAATVAAAAGTSYFWLTPTLNFSIMRPVDLVQWLVLIMAGVLVSLLSASLHAARRRDRAALAQLRESEELFAKAFQSSPDCLAIVRMSDRTVVRANDALCRLWGRTPDEVIGQPTREYSNWSSEEERIAFMQTLEDRRECLNHETTLRMADGRLMEFKVSSRMIAVSGEPCMLSVMRDITERNRAEEAAAHLAAIVESSDDAIIGKDLSGIITSWNGGAEKIFGYPAQEMIGQPIMRLIPAGRQTEEAEILGHIRQGESIRHFDTVRLRKDGGTVDISVTVSAVRNSRGNIVGASKVARDITGRKQAEAALRASEGRYRALFEYAPDGIVIADPKGYYHDANASLCRMLGYTRDELIRLHSSDIVSPLELAYIEPALNALNTKSDYHREWQLRRKDGSVFPAEVIGTAMPDGNILAMIRDISERRQAERRLGMRNAVSRVLADAGSLAEATPGIIRAICEAELWDFGSIWEVDAASGALCCREIWHRPDFKGEAMAARTRGLTFASGQGLPGRVWAAGEMQLIPDVALDDGYLRAQIATAAGLRSALAFPIFVGSEVTGVIDFNAREIRQPDEQLIEMFTAIGRQVGQFIERHRAEEQVRRLNVELEQRVIERTAQLEAANKELEAFSYSVSHDLRAPLRAVDGFSMAVLEDFGPQLPEEGQRQLQTIRRSAQRMGELIDDLLTFSRLSRQPLKQQTVEMDALVRVTLAEMQTQGEGRQIKTCIGELPQCEGDPALLKQVWVNLLSNALKYTGKRVQAVVEAGCTEQQGERVYFVRDNGSGFDMRYAHKLFGVFQRLHRAEDYEGTGVGLAIVQRIIQRHGGRIWAEAAVDRGATFYFTLRGTANP
jgi:PAS domain S-box-containing protein